MASGLVICIAHLEPPNFQSYLIPNVPGDLPNFVMNGHRVPGACRASIGQQMGSGHATGDHGVDSMPSEADQVRERFIAERDYIQQYVHFVQKAAEIPDYLVGEINERLSVHGLPELPARKEDRVEEVYSPGEMEALIKTMASIESSVEQKIEQLDEEHAALLQKKFENDRQDQLVGEWTDWFANHLAYDPDPRDVEGSLKYAKNQAPESEDADDGITPKILEEIIEEGCRRAVLYANCAN